jgi:uncharacterized protein (DUF1800 family)
MISERVILATRFGYGLPAPEAPVSVEAVLAQLAAPDLMAARWPIAGQAELFPLLAERRGIKREAGTDAQKQAHEDQLKQALAEMLTQAERRTFARAVESADGFRERLVAFWANHFSVVSRNAFDRPLPFALVEDAIRPNLTGSFVDLLTAVTLHPAMLSYLDQANSIGPNSKASVKRSTGLNENLARELMELHTLGVGAAYTQADVTEMAKLLTGVTYTVETGMRFEPNRAEPGAEVVLGKRYGGEGMVPVRAALRDLALRPETSAHIARKLAVHFVADSPNVGQVAAMTQAFEDSGGDLTAVYRAMLGHAAALDPAMQKVRQPYDFLVAASRAIGLGGAELDGMEDKRFRRAYLNPMAQMGQRFKHPDGPNGFPEAAEAWVTPMGLAHRIAWAMVQPRVLLQGSLPNPEDLVQSCLAERASPVLRQAAARAEDKMQGVALVLASTEFNRR